MLARRYRFHGHRSLQNVYRHGQQSRGALFTVKSMATPNRKTARIAVVVNKKVSKSAVVRNRIRRRIYEVMRLKTNETTTPHDIVFIVHDQRLETKPHEELRKEINEHLSLTKSK